MAGKPGAESGQKYAFFYCARCNNRPTGLLYIMIGHSAPRTAHKEPAI